MSLIFKLIWLADLTETAIKLVRDLCREFLVVLNIFVSVQWILNPAYHPSKNNNKKNHAYFCRCYVDFLCVIILTYSFINNHYSTKWYTLSKPTFILLNSNNNINKLKYLAQRTLTYSNNSPTPPPSFNISLIYMPCKGTDATEVHEII